MRICFDELRLIFGDKRLWLIMIGGPFLYVILFGLVYLGGRVKDVPIMVIDRDRSSLSREMIQLIDASDSLEVQYSADSTEAFKKLSTEGKVSACIEFPEGFSSKIKRGGQGSILVILDGSNTLTANVVYRSVRTAIATYRVGARMKAILSSGVPRSAAYTTANPIGAEYRPLYNAASNYDAFMLLGLVCIALQQVTMMGASISSGLSNEYNYSSKYYNNVIYYYLFRALTHILIMVPLALLAISLVFAFFGSPFRGNVPEIFAVSALFVLIQIFSGFGIAGFFRNTTDTVRFLLCASVPMFLFSGFTWPLQAMPNWLQFFSSLLPLTYYSDYMRRAAIVGAPASVLENRIGVLLAWLVVAVVWGYWGTWKNTRPVNSE